MFKSADHSLDLVLACLHCCPDFRGLQYTLSLVTNPTKQRWWFVSDALQTWGLLPSLLPSASLLAGDNMLYTLQSTSGCRSDWNMNEMLQMQSCRPGLRCWWAVRLWCTGLGGEGCWGGQQDMGRGYTGGKESSKQDCDIVYERKSWRAKVQLGCQSA